MATLADLKKLYRGGLPRDMANPNRNDGDVDDFASIMASVDGQMGFWVQQSRLGTATGVYIDEHGRDRGLRRAGGETDEQFRARLRLPPTALTLSAIRTALADLLGTQDFYIVELPHKSAYYDRNTTLRGFYDRGDRMGGGRGVIIAIIPASLGMAKPALGVLRAVAAAGKIVRVEEYTTQ